MPSVSDITQARPWNEAALDVFELMEEGVALFDADFRLRFANLAFRKMHAAMSDLLSAGISWDFFLREAVRRGSIPAPVRDALQKLEGCLEEQNKSHDRILMPVAGGKSFVLRLAQTSDGGVALLQSDDTDLGAQLVAANEAERLLRKVLEACPASLIMSRVNDGHVLYRSPEATDLLGTAKSSFAYFANRIERADFVTALLPDAAVDNMRVTCLDASGKPFPAEMSARLIEYNGEDVIVASVEDLTHELEVQAELDRRNDQLFQSEKLSALGELLASVSHELNNPLSIIVGNADILTEELEGTQHEARVGKVSKAAHRCIRIVRSFLSLARQEPLAMTAVAPTRLIETAREVVAGDAEKAGIDLSVFVSTDCPEIIVDETQLTQVIINLLTNAIQAIQETGHGNCVTVDCMPSSSGLKIAISDNGPGVPEGIRRRVFDPLFTTKEAGKGTGVGLAFCHRIVSAHGGRILLASDNQEGATFNIQLPSAVLASARN